MYGTIPIAAGFVEQGMEEDWIAAFCMSSILLNPQLFFYSVALGPAALAIRFTACFVCGALAGICVRYCFKKCKLFSFAAFKEPQNRDTEKIHM
ncbi:MAG: hypothetical protein LBT14_08030 [Treponema sp.]|jgi:uncharacterized membrane protein YraQ (UPF0718 family)|nr:hypothetical protein [Treponema sp.]